ncbi:MAG: DUF3021 family protein [Lachnospiraceae bacterium]|nr:DUF3021 family protein [Lachnospiraceae bacterium]
MWNKIKEFVRTFAYVVLGVEISTTTFITIFYPGILLSVALLWQILACSFVCTLGNILWWTTRRLGKTEIIIRIVIHYVYINFVVFGSALLFNWIDYDNPVMIISMFVMVLVVFIAVFFSIWYYSKRISEMMNQGLKAYQKGKE